MKKLLLAIFASGITMAALAQTDTTGAQKSDTIKIGGMIIIKNHGGDNRNDQGRDNNEDGGTVIRIHHHDRNANVSTNWGIVDLGFANFNDQTNYSSAEAQAFAPAFNKEQMKLRNIKSVNVNIWFFMQRLNVVKHVVNLKYGLGLELNNYRFDDTRVHFHKNPTLITADYTGVDKNKLAADYVTVPMMVNFNLTPGKRKGFGFSAGMSAGYLYSARQKIKGSDGKHKLHDDFDLRSWKLSYIGELNLGPVKLYGSYALRSMWEKGLDQTPYNVGIRLNSW
ncbi:MAG: outer membrane beta-barrel protein [Flavisolibacter sp.]